MTNNEYVRLVLESKKETPTPYAVDDPTIYEVAQLISGAFTYPLYEALWMNNIDVKSVTQHLESLYDSENYFGLVYFVFILANAIDFVIPRTFSEMSVSEKLVPILSAAIIEDWLEYDATSEAAEYTG